ncbi:gluconolaconase [Pedobacter sp. MR2016-24]|uniref:beta-propeller domain-containing protein n=1 Tax=Pedobacter sp. MR2016-24 TaxID=2994466 RepID=UPI0022483079|nr:gluconolaconase [Pedobacter sp. MR2016-24]MCX2486774.1 gluconolaconase [Pedobacter sp. MR2016-24]
MKALTYIALGVIGLATIAAVNPAPTTRIEFDALESYPEGITFDKVANVYYVSSARLGNIGTVTPTGVYSVLHADTTLKSTYGLKIHPDGKHLFACVSDANYSKYTHPLTRMKMARLIAVDLKTGKKTMDTDLSRLIPGKHFANDLAFDAQNNAYVTDSFAGAIYKVSPDGKATVFAKDELFKTAGTGLNGIVFHPDGYLIVDNSAKGQLFKVDLKNPKNVSRIVTGQYFTGADGLLLTDKNTLTMVVNGGIDKIFQLSSTDNWQSAKVSASTLVTDRFTYPATATQNGKNIWVMNAQFNQLLDSNSVPVKTFAIQQVNYIPVK